MQKLIILFFMFSFFSKPHAIAQGKVPQNIYDYSFTTLDGSKVSMSSFKGKKILIVNTASKCGYTPQFQELEKLHEQYKDKLVIIGFPANNFLFQEPGTNSEIKEFCTRNYGVSFTMANKISVKGKKIDPLYVWLTSKKYNGVMDSGVKWNFQKYLISENGKLLAMFEPGVKPMDEKIISAINN